MIASRQSTINIMVLRPTAIIVLLAVFSNFRVTGLGEDSDSDVYESFHFGEERGRVQSTGNYDNDVNSEKRGRCQITPGLQGPPEFACKNEINAQIKEELKASHIYMAMSAYFHRYDISLPGFQDFFHKASDEERDHAKKLMGYLNQRGGVVKLGTEYSYSNMELDTGNWFGAQEALETALKLEKSVTEKLLAVHKCGEDNNDPNLQDYIESEFLTEQYKSMEELANMVTKVNRLGCGVGLHMFDQELK